MFNGSHSFEKVLAANLDMLRKLQKRVCRTVGPFCATSLESLAHHQNVASIFSIGVTFGR